MRCAHQAAKWREQRHIPCVFGSQRRVSAVLERVDNLYNGLRNTLVHSGKDFHEVSEDAASAYQVKVREAPFVLADRQWREAALAIMRHLNAQRAIRGVCEVRPAAIMISTNLANPPMKIEIKATTQTA